MLHDEFPWLVVFAMVRRLRLRVTGEHPGRRQAYRTDQGKTRVFVATGRDHEGSLKGVIRELPTRTVGEVSIRFDGRVLEWPDTDDIDKSIAWRDARREYNERFRYEYQETTPPQARQAGGLDQ